MDGPLVSVITPAYNHGQYIGRCIDSLLAQTYTNWEMVVVDDGSTDNTADVVRTYKDARISYVYQENQGVTALAATINSGMRRTSGKLVTMLGSDDMWPPYRLEKQVPVFRDPNVVLCFGKCSFIDENDRDLGENPLPRFVKEVMNRPVGSIIGSLLIANWLPQPTVLISRAALEQIGGYLQPPGLLAEDYPTHLAIALLGEFRYVDLPMGYYRMHSHQQTRLHIFDMRKGDVEMVMEFYRSLDPELRNLTGLTETRLARELGKTLNNCYFQEGRAMLLGGDRKRALRQFAKALWRGSPYTKAKAIAGLTCGLTGMDLEKVARLTGQPRRG